jgi:hypothetical protein
MGWYVTGMNPGRRQKPTSSLFYDVPSSHDTGRLMSEINQNSIAHKTVTIIRFTNSLNMPEPFTVPRTEQAATLLARG